MALSRVHWSEASLYTAKLRRVVPLGADTCEGYCFSHLDRQQNSGFDYGPEIAHMSIEAASGDPNLMK